MELSFIYIIKFMKPKFKNTLAWEQAQLLMQPAFIRVMDNIRKQLEESAWKASYQEISQPYPGYILRLTYRERSVDKDIWELCYQVCFSSYTPIVKHIFSDDDESTYEVEIDTRLIDENGEVDWHLLEAKAQQVVKELFDNLPKD
jgi:hypothetical protein